MYGLTRGREGGRVKLRLSRVKVNHATDPSATAAENTRRRVEAGDSEVEAGRAPSF